MTPPETRCPPAGSDKFSREAVNPFDGDPLPPRHISDEERKQREDFFRALFSIQD